MQTLFSTKDVLEKDRFRQWRDVCEDRLVPMDQSQLDDGAFDALIEGTSIGKFNFTKFSLQNVRAATSLRTIRHQNNKTDNLFLSLAIAGSVRCNQNERSSITKSGDFSIRDTNSPWEIEHIGHSEVIALELPRDRLENLLGSARYFAGITVEGHRPVTYLARSFLLNLIQAGQGLEAQASERMVEVGIDLIVASVAEQMAIDTPKSLRETLVLQKANRYIIDNLSRQDLNSALVAAASGVSLRYLQILFRNNGKSISGCIWDKRLEMAKMRLSDPVLSKIALKNIAFSCGFSDHAHFSRRFRDHYGLCPRDYRDSKSEF